MSRANSDAPPPANKELLTAGSRFGRYELVRCIGTGGMGSVFEAIHTLLKKPVALKTMHSGFVNSEAARLRFLREAETVARIRHANVVDISDVGIEQDVPYLVMELLEGEDLAHMLQRRGPLSQTDAVDAVLPIACGLSAVHRLGIVHRDVKPENVLLARVGGQVTPKLIDFGVSKDLDRSTLSEGYAHTVTGTPQYMAPEQARGASLDGRTDEYALGVMLYQCLSGRLPYESPSLLELIQLIDSGSFRPLRQVRPDVDEALCAVVERAMSRAPKDRYPTVAAFGCALLPFASERLQRLYESELKEPLTPSTLAAEAGELASSRTIAGPTTKSGVREREVSSKAATRPKRALNLAAVALFGFAIAGAVWLYRRTDGPAPTREKPTVEALSPLAKYRVRLRVSPGDAEIVLDGATVGVGALDRELVRDGTQHTLRISRAGYEPQILTLRDQPPPSEHITLRALEPAASAAPHAPERTPPRRSAPPPDRERRAEEPPAPEPTEPLDIQLTR